ncbi:MAG: hypothetical protein RJA57_1575 [Bacteroidota bacterium]
MGRTLYFTVTNDLSYDQRMQRICGSLAAAGYRVHLIGYTRSGSIPLRDEPYRQRRLFCLFRKGKAFYIEYNVRLFLYLLFRRMDAVCAIDLDTLLPCYCIATLKRVKRVYDAHELFTELREVVRRPVIRRIWSWLERRLVPRFPNGYTVSDGIAAEFKKRYQVSYEVIRNVPILQPLPDPSPSEPFILYQGAVNEGRCFEYLIPALQWVRAPLVVCGDGNFMPQLQTLIERHGVADRVVLKGMVTPEELRRTAATARVGVALAEEGGLNQYWALPNKFFDYLHAGLPQLTMDFPEYRSINERYEVAVLTRNLDPRYLASLLNKMLEDDVLYGRLRSNCLNARKIYQWEQEKDRLLRFYEDLFRN